MAALCRHDVRHAILIRDHGDAKARSGPKDRHGAIFGERSIFAEKQLRIFSGQFRYGMRDGFEVIDQAEFCQRSEEHTSELHYLMRKSNADFCWKKKKKN